MFINIMKKNETKIIVYAKEGDMKGDLIKEMIAGLVPQANVEAYGVISDLLSRLHLPQRDYDIAILFAADREDLKEIFTIRPLLDNVRIILVLPDRQSETIKIGHSLRPRYLSFNDSPVSDVVFVLIKMIEAESVNKKMSLEEIA